jgi:hypothetical protein
MSGYRTPYSHFLEQLPTTIDRLVTNAGGDMEIQLPLKLDLLPAMLQFLLSTGQISTDHVAYQSLERLTLLALNKERTVPAKRFAPLLEFATAQKLRKFLETANGRACKFPKEFLEFPVWAKTRNACNSRNSQPHRTRQRKPTLNLQRYAFSVAQALIFSTTTWCV